MTAALRLHVSQSDQAMVASSQRSDLLGLVAEGDTLVQQALGIWGLAF